MVKKHVMYDKELVETQLINLLHSLQAALGALERLHGLTDDDIHSANLQKLGARYANLQYSNIQAQVRADKA